LRLLGKTTATCLFIFVFRFFFLFQSAFYFVSHSLKVFLYVSKRPYTAHQLKETVMFTRALSLARCAFVVLLRRQLKPNKASFTFACSCCALHCAFIVVAKFFVLTNVEMNVQCFQRVISTCLSPVSEREVKVSGLGMVTTALLSRGILAWQWQCVRLARHPHHQLQSLRHLKGCTSSNINR